MNLSKANPVQSVASRKPWKIWIIDDDPVIRSVMKTALSDELSTDSLQIQEIESFAAALEAFSASMDVDLIILDNTLGDGDGIDLLPKIRCFSDQHQLAQVPVMIVSGNEDQRFLAECFSMGASDFVTKPFDVNLFGYKVHAMLVSKANRDRVLEQNVQLEQLVAARQREEVMASFTYEFYLRRTQGVNQGVCSFLRSPNAFSGDLLLSARSPEGHIIFMLADSMGHDLSAAITLMPMVSIFETMVGKGFRLAQILLELNDKLLLYTPEDRFVAAILLKVDPQAGKIEIWNGGMPPVLEVTQDGELVKEYSSEHMALGVLAGSEFSTATQVIDLCSDHWLLLMSDGLFAQGDKGNDYLDLETVKRNLVGPPQKTLAALEQAHNQLRRTQPLLDDVSVCAIEPRLLSAMDFRQRNVGINANLLKPLRAKNFFECRYSMSGQNICETQIPVLLKDLLDQLDLSQQLSERIFTIVAELFVNAVDHGLLQLESNLKEGPEGFFVYMQEREKRLKSLSGKDRVDVQIAWDPDASPGALTISVADTGGGFSACSELQCDGVDKFFGRGLLLVRSLACELKITPPGNKLTAVLKSGTD